MGHESFEAAIARVGSPVELLRNSAARPHLFPVAPEFTNWCSEQRAWRTSCALFDQSHDLHPHDRGPKGTHDGAVLANGNLYCPQTPRPLLELGHRPGGRERGNPAETRPPVTRLAALLRPPHQR